MDPQTSKYEYAKKRVGQLKKFYSHISVYIFVNIALVLLKLHLFNSLESWSRKIELSNVRWTDWEITSTPIIWGVFLIGHGIWVFSAPSRKKWEEKKIQEYMQSETED